MQAAGGGPPGGTAVRTAEGEPWDSDKIAQRFGYYKAKLAKAGVKVPKNYFAYCYRHTLLTELLESGESETKVAAIAGHKGTATLHKNYSHILAKKKSLADALRGHIKGRGRTPQPGGGAGGAGPSSDG